MPKNTYQRITYREEGAKRSKTIYLRNPRPTQMFGEACTVGTRVDAEGDEITGRVKGKLADTVTHIVADSLVRRRTFMVMDQYYGELVVEGTQRL